MWSEQGTGGQHVVSGTPGGRRAGNSSAAALLAYDVPHRARGTGGSASTRGRRASPPAPTWRRSPSCRRQARRDRARSGCGRRRSLAAVFLAHHRRAPDRRPRAPRALLLIFTSPQWRSWLVRAASDRGLRAVLAAHLSRAARRSTRARAASTWPPSPEGALGRLGGARLEGLARAGREALHARADDLLQLRVGVRAARLRRPRHARGPQVRGQPRAPRLARAQLRQGPATLNQVDRPGPHPLPAEARRGARRGEVGAGVWDEALDDIAAASARRSSRSAERGHVPRRAPGEDGYTERVLAAWGVDGHNSHTNVCSSAARAGYHSGWGSTGPSPDHANAKVILLISSHLESGHYFNPHAQRIIERRRRGAKLIVFDTRLSNTATHADHWLAPWPGSEAAILLAIANHLITGRYDREFVRRWWNWREYLLAEVRPRPADVRRFEEALAELYAATPSSSRPPSPASTPRRCARSPSSSARPAPGSRRTPGGARPRATWAAGRWRAACSC
jgi:hypothetical protein